LHFSATNDERIASKNVLSKYFVSEDEKVNADLKSKDTKLGFIFIIFRIILFANLAVCIWTNKITL